MKRAIVFTSVLVGVVFMSSSATIINIPDDYPTIQEGIDASVNGDTVLVEQGVWLENIFIGHNITLASHFLLHPNDTTYISSTIIDGGWSGSVIDFGVIEDTTAVLTGFTIRNGDAGAGGGIHFYQFDPVIRWNFIEGNHAEYGGGIFCHNSTPIIEFNSIRYNYADSGGGGINCHNHANATIKYNSIKWNVAEWGGGINFTEYSDGEISNNKITGDTARSQGGGIFCYGFSDPEITNNTISANDGATAGGGIVCDYFSRPTMTNCIVWGNTAPNDAGIHLTGSSALTIRYSDIQDTLWPGPGNISIDPLFRDPNIDNFRLMAVECDYTEDSPCIDAGDPDIIDRYMHCAWGLGSRWSDMGQYGGGLVREGEGVICSIGAVHNYISNSTVAIHGDEQTILIGDGTYLYPSMLWTVPPEYADINHYLYYAYLRLGYDHRIVKLSTDTSPGLDVFEPGERSDFDTHFYISDQSVSIPPEQRIGVRVHQYTFAWDEEEANDFIIYDYWIVNLNSHVLDSFYVALQADCDVSHAEGGSGDSIYYSDDLVGYVRDDDNQEYISYMYDGDNAATEQDDEGGYMDPLESTGYIGSRLLYCPPIVGDSIPTVQSGHDWWDSYHDPDDSALFNLMSDPIWLDPPPNPADYRYFQKTGPFEISAGDSIRVVFAFGIGEGIDGLRSNLEVARIYFEMTPIDETHNNLPFSFVLKQNYPNPFNAETVIQYGLAEESYVTIHIYDLLGRRVETLVQAEQQAGYHQVVWDAKDQSSGMYFYRIQAGEYTETKKMVLLK